MKRPNMSPLPSCLAKGFPNGMSYRTVLRGPQHCLAMCQSPLKVCPGGLYLPLQRPWKNELFCCPTRAWEYPVPEDSSVRIIHFRFISWKFNGSTPSTSTLSSSFMNRPTFRWQWSSGHHPNCSWIRFPKHFVIVSISSRWWGFQMCSEHLHLFTCSLLKWYLFQLGALNQWAPHKRLGSIEARREQKELLASLSKAIRKSDIIGVRVLVLYPGFILDAGWHKVLIAAHWLKVIVGLYLHSMCRISVINHITDKTQARV